MAANDEVVVVSNYYEKTFYVKQCANVLQYI